MTEVRFDVLGIGNALVDVVGHTDDAFLAANGLVKGAMTLIEPDRSEELYQKMREHADRAGSPVSECSGGSVANTMAGIASLGARGAYVGKVRDDALGRVFTEDIHRIGLAFDVAPAAGGPATGRCMVFVTPDGERTMQTCLGASATLSPADIDPGFIQAAAIVYLEGYLWDPPPAMAAFREAARIAHGAGRRVALTLSDSFCVERHLESFRELVRQHVDILFANEAEVKALTGAADLTRAIAAVRYQCGIGAVTVGARGALVATRDAVVAVPASPVERVVDTTGAGDLFAAGFLFGLSRGWSPERSGQVGSLAAAEVISHFGARPQTSLEKMLAERMGHQGRDGESEHGR